VPNIGKSQVRVRYAETDRMGVVYHANYFIWFEVGRNEFFRQVGLIYRNLETDGIIFPLVSCQAEFKAGARYDDMIDIETWVEKIQGIRITLGYRVLRDQELICSGTTTHIFSRLDRGPCNLKKLRPEVWQVFEKLHQGSEILCPSSNKV
jgi:acyl-CoA thioester hydrolase